MLRPIINPKLSLRARSLFYYYVEKGRVMSADQVWETKDIPEGRDAILSAIRELKSQKYITSVRVKVGNSWRLHYKFTESALEILRGTSNGFSGHLYIDNYKLDSLTTSTNIDKDTNVSLSIGAAPLKENLMGWNLNGDEDKVESKSVLRRLAKIKESEPAPGAVGKIEDRQAKLNAKYKVTKSEHEGRNRSDTPEELWSTNDLVAEFYSLAESSAPGVPSQVNSKYIATWINKQVGEGALRLNILTAIRMFFSDTRNTNNAGIGKPLWQRFFSYYPTVYGVVTRSAPVYDDPETMAQQEKMLRLLEGE